MSTVTVELPIVREKDGRVTCLNWERTEDVWRSWAADATTDNLKQIAVAVVEWIDANPDEAADWLQDAANFAGERAVVTVTSEYHHTDFELTAQQLRVVFEALAENERR